MEKLREILCVLIFIISEILMTAEAQCLTGNDRPQIMNQLTPQAIKEARFDFALIAMKKASELETQDNIFFSPRSLHEALSLVYFGTRGITEETMKNALQIPNNLSKIDVQRFYAFEKSVERVLKENVSLSYEYNMANRLWLTNAIKARECMISLFGDELKRTEFRKDPGSVRMEINSWVKNTTKGNILDLIPVNGITEDTDIVLVNAVYFKGMWQSRFREENTKRDIFYIAQDNMVVTKFMKQKGTFGYMISEDLGAHILDLPYIGNDVSMYILLPPFVSSKSGQIAENAQSEISSDFDGIKQVLQKISEKTEATQALRDILNNGMPVRDVEVSLPKFTLERELPVKQLLGVLGAGTVFDPINADLRGFFESTEKSPYLGNAIHRARIDVTEEGTTAAAATALFSFRSSRPVGPAVFTANHPFIYFVYERPTRSIIFAGIFRKPNSQKLKKESIIS